MLAATLATIAAAPTKPSARLRNAAKQVILRQADFGLDWSSTPPPQQVPTLTCPAFNPNLSKLPQPGAAVSPTFQQSDNGPFASQSAYVFPKASQAVTFWQKVVTQRLGKCVAGALTVSSTSSVKFAVKSTRSLKVPAIGDRRAGYRVTGTASTTAQKVTVYLDMIVVGHGTGVSQISLTTFSQPPRRSLELRLARLIARRLPAGTGASKR